VKDIFEGEIGERSNISMLLAFNIIEASKSLEKTTISPFFVRKIVVWRFEKQLRKSTKTKEFVKKTGTTLEVNYGSCNKQN
jgi:hypothetical protein